MSNGTARGILQFNLSEKEFLELVRESKQLMEKLK